jgi:hypothetical protein
MYQSVSADTFKTAAALLERGVDLPRLYDRIYAEAWPPGG